MEKVEIYWGADKDFEAATELLENVNFLADILNHINKTDLKIEGVNAPEEPPMEVENLLVHTDDYGGVKEWALLGFSNNVLRNRKVNVKNLWLCNPPQKIYEDVIRNYDKEIVKEHRTSYREVTIEDMRKMAEGFDEAVIGQPHVMQRVLASIYALKISNVKDLSHCCFWEIPV